MITNTTTNYLSRLLLALTLGWLCLLPVSARAEAEGIVRYNVSQQSLDNDFINGYGENGYRPSRLTCYVNGKSVRFFTRWVQNTDDRDWRAYGGKTLAQFDAIFADLTAQGFRMVDTSGCETPNGVRFAMIWEKNTPPTQVYRHTTFAGMQTLASTIGEQGWVPHRIEGYEYAGQPHYTSIWHYQPGTGYNFHVKMTNAQYQEHLDDYRAQGLALFHLHAFTVGNTVHYIGIWKPSTSFPRVRSNRDVLKYQRYYNNYWADGYNIDNFYAAATPNGVRFGAIWFFDGVPSDTTLYNRVRKEVDGAPALGGAFVLNLTTGEEVVVHDNQTFAIASTSKIGILYAVLKEIDEGNLAWTEFVNSNLSTGSNGCNYMQPNTEYRIDQLAAFMIRCSSNWATNVLIAHAGRTTINNHLDDAGLDITRIHRYMSGGPSAHGNASASADRAEGYENLSTPREMVRLLRKVLQNNLLSDAGEDRFWTTLRLDTGSYPNNKSYIADQVTPMFNPRIEVYNKPGSLGDPGATSRHVNADAGRFTFPDGQEVLIAVFMDYVSDDPDEPLEVTTAEGGATQAIKNVAKLVAEQYYPY